MSTLTKEIKNNVIIFFDSSKKFITKEQTEKIFQASSNPNARGINIENCYISFAGISKIITIEEFYKQYPQELPVPQKDMTPYQSIERQALSSEKMKNGLIAGIEQFIAEEEAKGVNPLKAKALLENWKLKQI